MNRKEVVIAGFKVLLIIMRALKSRTMGWTGCVPYMGEVGYTDGILAGKLQEKWPHGKHRHRWRIILKWI
jgi:hypothetical protein